MLKPRRAYIGTRWDTVDTVVKMQIWPAVKVIGTALLVVSVPAAITLFSLGSYAPVAARPSTPLLVSTNNSSHVWALSSGGGWGAVNDVDFLPGPARFIVGFEQPGLLVIPEGNYSAERAVSLGCPDFISTYYYPGSGPDLFVQCVESQRNSEVMVLNATSLNPVANISLNVGYRAGTMAYDPTDHLLFVSMGDSSLDTVNLTSMRLQSSIVLAGGYGSPMVFDVGSGSLLTSGLGNRSIQVVRPTTGTVIRTLPMPGNVTSLAEDVPSGRVLVSDDNGQPDVPGKTLVLNATTLAQVGTILTGTDAGMWVDSTRGRLYMGCATGICAFSLNTYAPIDSTLDYGDVTTMALDPVTGVFGRALVTSNGVYFGTLQPVLGQTVYPSYSAVPLVGTNFPLVLAVAGSLVGLSLLIARGVLSLDGLTRTETNASSTPPDPPPKRT